jgi:serine/threonine protein kinase
VNVRELKRGDTIGQLYLVLDKLGEGGNGSVFRCQNFRLGSDAPQLAVKVIYDVVQGSTIQRFARERDLLSQANHPNVLRCLDFGKHGEYPYIVLEFATGGSIHHYLTERRWVDDRLAAWIIYQACAGLRAVGTVHRDMKPENLLIIAGKGQKKAVFIIGDVENGARVVVADYGLAMDRAPTPQRLTLSTDIVGTPYYISPEQAASSKKVTVATDIYALGIILYELVCGDPPFLADSLVGIVTKHATEVHQYPTNRPVSPALRTVIDCCLQKDPANRYPSLRCLQEALLPILAMPSTWCYLGLQEPPEKKGGTSFFGKITDSVRGVFKR